MVNDGNGNAPTYDAENRIASDAGVTYYYDAEGMRTEKSSGTKYWYGPGGGVLMESALNGTINEEYIYLNGERVARVDRPSGTVNYYFSDNVGSASVIASASGTIQEQYYYYPYGGSVASIGSDPNHYKFTGKERDSESNLDNFGARYYTSSIGRFMTPDWAARATAVPYAVFGDPQTLNLYSYVENAPVNRADADGHYAGFEYQLSGTGGFDASTMELTDDSDIGSGVQITVAQLVAQLNQSTQLQAQNQSASGKNPAPTNPDGKPKPPTNDVPKLPDSKPPGWKPGDPLAPNDWEVKDSGKGNRVKWGPKFPIPGQSQPGASWDQKLGHWDHDNGFKDRTHWLPGGGGQVDHFNNPIPSIPKPSIDMKEMRLDDMPWVLS